MKQPWFAVRQDFRERRSLTLKLASFLLPLAIWCAVSYVPFIWHPLVLVSHVTPIKTLLRMALDAGPSLFYRLHLDPASLSIAEFYPDGAAVVSLVNDTSHLSHGHP